MIYREGGVKVTTEALGVSELQDLSIGAKTLSRGEKVRRWLIIIGSIILVIFLVYLLLILVYPSMNIGTSP